MIAKRLEAFLSASAEKTDLSARSPADMVQRFQHLRGFGLLPKGRGRNAEDLSLGEMAAGILSIVTTKPGFAGLASKILLDLRAVGGIDASFERSQTLGKAVEALIESSSALESFIEMRVSDSEVYTNSHCRAEIHFRFGGQERIASYVGTTALSLQQPGAERNYNRRDTIYPIITETMFFTPFFQELQLELQQERLWPRQQLAHDDEEDREEDAQAERALSLGILRDSRFLNVGVDSHVSWPAQEKLIDFEGYKLVLMPRTRENATSIHIDLSQKGLTLVEARSLINRFLSLLSWCDDHYAVLQDGWAGNPVPVAVPRRNIGFALTNHWPLRRSSPRSEEARKALAIYREGRNAQENYLVSYAVLSFYKIIELKHQKNEAKKWLGRNYEIVKQDRSMYDRIAAFEATRGSERPADYLWRACRSAVAHANKPYTSNPDDAVEVRRLHVAADILRALARLFIRDELGVSDSIHDAD
jgi:hypothetical protein